MSEERTTSRTGGQKGVKPERHSLLPRPGLEAIARVFGFGATKYADHNWRKRYEWSKSYDALQRHITAFWDGEDNDPESGLPHLGHAGFHLLVLLTWLAEDGTGSEFDDRYVEPEPAQTDANVFGGFPRVDVRPFIDEVNQISHNLSQYAWPRTFIAGLEPAFGGFIGDDDFAPPREVAPLLEEESNYRVLFVDSGIVDAFEVEDSDESGHQPVGTDENGEISYPENGPLGLLLESMPSLRRFSRRPRI